MTLIDERGRLFGRVNVYDAAVVVLVVLGVAAGVLVLLDPLGADDDTDEASATRYLTVDLGERSPATAALVTPGDTDGGITVTDTYVGPAGGGNVSVLVRLRVEGTQTDDRFEYAGVPLSRGVTLDVETDAYDVAGTVVAVDTDGDTVATERTTVLVETAFSSATAVPVARTDSYRLGNRTVGRVTGLTAEPAGNGRDRPALVALSVETVSYDGRTYFGDRQLLVGERVPFRTDSYAFSGRVARLGSLREPTNATVTVELDGVDPGVAEQFEPGLVERTAGTTTARVTDVRIATVDGPTRSVNVTLTLDLRVRETDDGLRFRTRPLRTGGDIRLDFDTVVADGTVTDVDR